MYVKRIPILLPPWLYRVLSEKNLELAKIIDLDYLAEKFEANFEKLFDDEDEI